MRVLIVDDSAIIRAIFEQNLKKDSDIEIVGSVSTGRKAVDSIDRSCPDIILSDISMPEMDGLEAVKVICAEYKIPVILFSENSSDAIRAKAAGASEFFEKPALNSYDVNFFETLLRKMKTLISNNSKSHSSTNSLDESKNGAFSRFKILCIGASTGGPTAVSEVLSGLGRNFPLPIIYSQHIEIGADSKMAEWFSSTCQNVNFKLAKDGDEAKPGSVYMAPSDRHLVIDYLKPNGNPVLKISDDPPWRFLRPAVNVMFDSARKFYKKDCLAVLLTGMGRDGADGCRDIVIDGGHTIIEDESTCAVFGMPKAAIEENGASEILPRGKIASRILSLVGGL